MLVLSGVEKHVGWLSGVVIGNCPASELELGLGSIDKGPIEGTVARDEHVGVRINRFVDMDDSDLARKIEVWETVAS